MYTVYIWTGIGNTGISSNKGLRLYFFFRSCGALWLWNVFQALGMKTVFLISPSVQSKAHWGIWNFVLTSPRFELEPVGELGSLPTDTSREKSLLHPQGKGAVQCGSLPKWTLLSNYFSVPSYHIMGNLYLRTLRATHPMFSRDARVYTKNYWGLNLI